MVSSPVIAMRPDGSALTYRRSSCALDDAPEFRISVGGSGAFLLVN